MPPPALETPDRPPRRLVVLWAGLYAAASLCFCAPFLRLGGLDATPDWGDARLISWTLAWHARWPLIGQWPLDAPFFAPEPQALAYSDPMVALGLMAAPLTAWAGPTIAFNALRLLIPVANAVAVALLVWPGVRDARAAFVAGFAFAFAYSQVAVAYQGILHLALLAGIPLTARALDRWWHGARVRDLAWAVALACVQALVSWYSAVLAAIAIGVQLAWLATVTREPVPALLRRGRTLALAGLVAMAALWPLARPFLGTPAAPPHELRIFSLTPSDFLTPTTDTWTGALLTGTRTARDARWTDERAYAVGPVAAAAAVVGMTVALVFGVGRSLLWVVPLGAAAFLLALGPSEPGRLWHLFDLIGWLPGLSSFRAPFRMAVLVILAVAVLAGIAVRAVPERARSAATVLFLALLAGESYMMFLPATPPLARPLPTPAIFAALAEERPQALLVVPMLAGTDAWPSEADYLQLMLPTWTPLANGYGRRTPPIYDALREAVAIYPRGSLAESLRFYGITHVAVLAAYTEDRGEAFNAAALANSQDFEPVVADGGDALYRVRPVPAVQ